MYDISCKSDAKNLDKMLNPFFLGKITAKQYSKMLSAEIITQHAKH